MTSNKRRILVVDDDSLARREIVRSVERQGHTAAEADGGERALEMLRSEDFDLVLLDLLMPDVDGFEVLRRVKADATLGKVPVIVVTAVDEHDIARQSIDLGAVDHITKPVNHQLLEHRLRTVLAG